MAHSHTVTELTEADTRLPAKFAAWGSKGLVVGLILLALGVLPAALGKDGWKHFQFAYLTGYFFWLSIALGGLIYLCIQHIMRAGWGIVVRRMAENIVGTLPWMAILFLPILIPTLMGDTGIYKWADTAAMVAADIEALPGKVPVYQNFLNPTFWAVRAVVYFAVWIFLARFFVKQSQLQDQDGDPKRTRRMEMISAPAIFLFALTLTFAGFDWLMSLDPHWFSTIWGVYLFAGALLSFLSYLTLMTMGLQKSGAAEALITKEHYQDLGKLMFGFVFFWGYIAFSQYILIWYANIPEETIFYLYRQKGAWTGFTIVLLFGHLLIPFAGLLSKHVKRHKPTLAFWAVWLLVMHFVDMYWIVMPTLAKKLGNSYEIPFSFQHLAVWLGIGGIFFAFVVRNAGAKSIVPLRDPRLPESLAFENF